MEAHDPARVFISYAHDSPGHTDMVRRFATFLRQDIGLDARLDQWPESNRRDWSLWAIDQIGKADVILIVVSPEYKRLVDRRVTGTAEPPPLNDTILRTAGVQWILPVVFSGESSAYIPDVLSPYVRNWFRVASFTRDGAAALLTTISSIKTARPSGDDKTPQSDPFSAHAADYRPDTDDGVDQLGIAPDVRMLADLVASRMITPPLSIGLFGSWGSGKSFFMRQMQLRVRELADSAQEAESAARKHGKSVSSYCSSVRQIGFNAWHYSEANLLASLATHIFDNLAASGAENDLQRQADALAERRKTEKTLLGRLSAVRLERRTLTAQQKQAKRRRRKPREYVRAVFDSLTEADKAWIASRIGVDRPTAEDLEKLAQETGGLRSDVAEFWRWLRQDPVPLLVLIGGLVTVLVVTLLLGRSQVSGVLGGLTVVSSALTVVLRMRASAGRIHQALGKLGGPSEEDEETDRRLAELDAESDRLEKAVAELAPGLDLVSFAESRVSDYVEHLGVVSLLRKDLETFATMLAEVPHGSGKIERTVLYIDDLDRCPPKVVVQVLEAIHLLLALPVFVVVVGVDPRWLKKAVEQHYESMLGEDPETFAENYLEKIFQIPFTLSLMDEPGFAGLVRGLAATEGVDTTPAPIPVQPPQATVAPSPAASDPGPPRAAAPEPSSGSSTIDLRPPRLVISATELDFLGTLAPLARSPRSAKRLLNLYRLLRARFAGEELAGFLDGTREAPFRAVLVLLAVLVGHPEAVTRFFASIAGTDPEDDALEVVSSFDDHELRPKLERGLSGGSWPELAGSYQRWLPLVNRFSFVRED